MSNDNATPSNLNDKVLTGKKCTVTHFHSVTTFRKAPIKSSKCTSAHERDCFMTCVLRACELFYLTSVCFCVLSLSLSAREANRRVKNERRKMFRAPHALIHLYWVELCVFSSGTVVSWTSVSTGKKSVRFKSVFGSTERTLTEREREYGGQRAT